MASGRRRRGLQSSLYANRLLYLVGSALLRRQNPPAVVDGRCPDFGKVRSSSNTPYSILPLNCSHPFNVSDHARRRLFKQRDASARPAVHAPRIADQLAGATAASKVLAESTDHHPRRARTLMSLCISQIGEPIIAVPWSPAAAVGLHVGLAGKFYAFTGRQAG